MLMYFCLLAEFNSGASIVLPQSNNCKDPSRPKLIWKIHMGTLNSGIEDRGGLKMNKWET